MPYFDRVIATIEQPEMVARDGRHRERVYFYRRWPGIQDFPARWLQVLVLLPEDAVMGRFLSAWASRETGGKETLWRATGRI